MASRSIDFYAGLLSSEYAMSVKLQAALRTLIAKLDDVTQLSDALYQYFDIDQAIGAQQDILGEIIGLPRTLPFQPSYGVSPVLTDADYRVLQKTKIALNQWDGNQTSLYTLWKVLFPDARIYIHDNHAMNLEVFVDFPNASSIFRDCVVQGMVVPKPQGVRVDYYLVPPDPLFGCDYDDPYVSGCDRGWVYGPGQPWPKFGTDEDDALIAGCDSGFVVNA